MFPLFGFKRIKIQNDKGFISEEFWYTFDTFDECNKAFTSNRKFYENNHFFCKEENGFIFHRHKI